MKRLFSLFVGVLFSALCFIWTTSHELKAEGPQIKKSQIKQLKKGVIKPGELTFIGIGPCTTGEPTDESYFDVTVEVQLPGDTHGRFQLQGGGFPMDVNLPIIPPTTDEGIENAFSSQLFLTVEKEALERIRGSFDISGDFKDDCPEASLRYRVNRDYPGTDRTGSVTVLRDDGMDYRERCDYSFELDRDDFLAEYLSGGTARSYGWLEGEFCASSGDRIWKKRFNYLIQFGEARWLQQSYLRPIRWEEIRF